MIKNPSVSITTLSRLLGKLSSSIQAVFPAPLHYRFLQMAKTMALKKTQSYESTISLNQAAQEELLWWRNNLAAWNGRSLLRKESDLLTETDASNLGWGACCNGVRTGGIWSHQERLQHINCIAPVWETQPWYPLLLHQSVDFPRLFPTDPWLLGKEGTQHPLPQLQLAGWLVSANVMLQWEFQTRLKDSLFPLA